MARISGSPWIRAGPSYWPAAAATGGGTEFYTLALHPVLTRLHERNEYFHQRAQSLLIDSWDAAEPTTHSGG